MVVLAATQLEAQYKIAESVLLLKLQAGPFYGCTSDKTLLYMFISFFYVPTQNWLHKHMKCLLLGCNHHLNRQGKTENTGRNNRLVLATILGPRV